jgi:hypothetical protein
VADSGPGIPDDVASRLFQPFVTTKRQNMGSFDLPSIVVAYGGQLWHEPRRRRWNGLPVHSEGSGEAVAPVFPSQAASDRTAAMIAVAVAMRIMRTSWWGPRDVVQNLRLYKRPFYSPGACRCSI